MANEQQVCGGYVVCGISPDGTVYVLYYGVSSNLLLRLLSYIKALYHQQKPQHVHDLVKQHKTTFHFVPLWQFDNPPLGLLETLESACMAIDMTLGRDINNPLLPTKRAHAPMRSAYRQALLVLTFSLSTR